VLNLVARPGAARRLAGPVSPRTRR
jgi:hypothetical protein